MYDGFHDHLANEVLKLCLLVVRVSIWSHIDGWDVWEERNSVVEGTGRWKSFWFGEDVSKRVEEDLKGG